MMIPAFPACSKKKTSYYYHAATILSAVIVHRLYLIVQLVAHQSSRKSKSTSDILILDCLHIQNLNNPLIFSDSFMDFISLVIYHRVYILGLR